MNENNTPNTASTTCPCQQQNISGQSSTAMANQQPALWQQQSMINSQQNTNSIVDNPMFTQGYLRGQIGKLVRVQFLIGTSNLQDRTGVLTQVGTSYIVLRSLETGTDIFCDIYSIKFVTIANQQVGLYGMPV